MLFCSILPSQAEIDLLPAFPRDKLNLHKLLGSGAFGEVYEGTAVDILADGSGETKVAVKVIAAVQCSGNKMDGQIDLAQRLYCQNKHCKICIFSCRISCKSLKAESIAL